MKINGLRDPDGKLVKVQPGLIVAYNEDVGTVTFLIARGRPLTIVPLTINGREHSREIFSTVKDFAKMVRDNAKTNGDLVIDPFETMPEPYFAYILRAK